MPPLNSENALYSQSQVDKYLARIAFPVDKWPTITPAAACTEDGLAYLAKLQKHHLCSIPFENTCLHYAVFPGVSLEKEVLFEKIVELRKGGYCMEQNSVFATILRTLGYEVIQSGARVIDPAGEIGGWNHQVNFVLIAGQPYLVDVGFGGPGSTQPLPLVDGAISKWGATKAETRLTYQEPKNAFLQGTWFYQHRISDAEDWNSIYTFTTTEFHSNDFDVMSCAVSTRRNFTFFTQNVLCMKMILDEAIDDIVGILVLNNKSLKRRIQADSEVLVECSSEDERVQVLKGYFGLDLSAKERAGIKGTVAEIK